MKADNFYISTDKTKLNIQLIHDFLCYRSYWAGGRSREMVEKSIRHSFCFAVFDSQDQQVGFARVITDHAVYAYILDLFILESQRGQGLGKMLMRSILSHAELHSVQKWTLATRDAHSLYAQYGFVQVSKPEKLMERISKS